jgi:FAD/FMN-containing dehydrogenase
VCPAPELLEPDRAWVRDLQDALAPHAVDATYVNAITTADETQVRASYGPEKYERLVQIKRRYDPQNLFRRNANINPDSAVPRQRTIDITTPGVVSST